MNKKNHSGRSVRTIPPKVPGVIAAVSGGPDSVFLLMELIRRKEQGLAIGHVNYGARGRESEKDQLLVEETARRFGIDVGMHRTKLSVRSPGFEEKAREIRRGFLRRLSEDSGGKVVAMGHNADDQVETILMRFFEGAGISGLKGIPRETETGIVRPILDIWKDDILAFLRKQGIRYREDRSNTDTRFERNWIRHTLIPLLEKRYGKAVKKRIFSMGERFRELDDYLDAEAARWIRRNARVSPRSPAAIGKPDGPVAFVRKRFSGLPTALRVKILQKICFEHVRVSPNERLLAGMDRAVRHGGPSAEMMVGKGWRLVNRYEDARFVHDGLPVAPFPFTVVAETAGKITPARAKKLAANGDAEVFDAAILRLPLSVRRLRPGDRIRPFGMDGEKKMKDIFIDRKIPREERWRMHAVCDSGGEILWVPGAVRSAHAPVTRSTRCVKIIRYLPLNRGDVAP
jgi:tRNA(Ile)-lysidine synthetase-like protein